jgi:hypothetical protein
MASGFVIALFVVFEQKLLLLLLRLAKKGKRSDSFLTDFTGPVKQAKTAGNKTGYNSRCLAWCTIISMIF